MSSLKKQNIKRKKGNIVQRTALTHPIEVIPRDSSMKFSLRIKPSSPIRLTSYSLEAFTSNSPIDLQRIHIIKRDEGWAVKKQGAQRAFKICPTKKDAEMFTRKLLREGHDIIVHKDDGTIESWKTGK